MTDQHINRAFRPVPNSIETHKEWALEHRNTQDATYTPMFETQVKMSRALDLPLFVDVITASRDPLAPPEQTHRINYNSERAKRWLKSHMTWALNTGRTVHLAAVQSCD